jgi:hypothetical protein
MTIIKTIAGIQQPMKMMMKAPKAQRQLLFQ